MPIRPAQILRPYLQVRRNLASPQSFLTRSYANQPTPPSRKAPTDSKDQLKITPFVIILLLGSGTYMLMVRNRVQAQAAEYTIEGLTQDARN